MRLLLQDLRDAGYVVDHIPADRQEFIDELIAGATNDRDYMSEKQIDNADAKLLVSAYRDYYRTLPEKVQQRLAQDWGEAPGEVFLYDDFLLIPGTMNGNIFITMQPPRGFGENPDKIYHSPDCAPTHHYIGFYHWLRDIWGADAMMHIGTHGSLEWLPGKGVAMGNECYPDICTGDLPNVYPYWVVDTGEGIQAKRRSAACLISYLSAPLSISGVYDELAELEKALDALADPDSELRRQVDNWLLVRMEDYRHDIAFADWLNSKLSQLATAKALAFKELLQTQDVDILLTLLQKRLQLLADSEVEQSRLDDALKALLLQALAMQHDTVYDLVLNKLQSYDRDELIAKMEQRVGDDLQNIRKSGTCIGGLMGAVLFIIATMAERLVG